FQQGIDWSSFARQFSCRGRMCRGKNLDWKCTIKSPLSGICSPDGTHACCVGSRRLSACARQRTAVWMVDLYSREMAVVRVSILDSTVRRIPALNCHCGGVLWTQRDTGTTCI